MNKYYYSAYVTSVYDGDTITVDLDLGLGVWMRGQKLRLYGINTPELRGSERKEGMIVRDYVRGEILNTFVLIKTHKDKKGKYGRWLAEVFKDGNSLNDELLSLGFAKPY